MAFGMKRNLCVYLSTAHIVALLSLVVAGLANLALASPGSYPNGADTCPDSSSMLQSKVKVVDSFVAQSAEVSEKGGSSLQSKVHADINTAGTSAQGKPPLVDRSHRATSVVRHDSYCHNRGGVAGSNEYSKNVGANQAAACASHAASTDGCGRWFSYGHIDGWCDCVKKGDGACAYSGYAGYDVYKLPHRGKRKRPTDVEKPPLPSVVHRDAYCHNRGGVGGSNEYSINVGANDAAACASHAASTDGCGEWFSYGQQDGWCDCVKEVDGPCDPSTFGGYNVYKLH